MGSKIEICTAEKIFATRGFIASVAPLLLTCYIPIVVVILYINREHTSSWLLPFALFGAFVVGALPQLVTYGLARGKHFEFKSKFGMTYVRLIEDGKISLTAAAVLFGGAPGRYREVIEKEFELDKKAQV